MFRHLLVPLDGSPMAEAALTAAARLSGLLGVPVTLLHAIERGAPQSVHGEPHLSSPDGAGAYLTEAAARVFPAGQQADTHVHSNEVDDVARSIADHAEELGDALIIMCTHGRGGLGNLLLGNIAQSVVRYGTAPVLLVPTGERAADRAFGCRRLMAPLDGTAPHEGALPLVRELAGACDGRVRLIFAVPTRTTLFDGGAAGRLLPGATEAMLEMAQQDAAAYLDRRAEELREGGVEVTTEVVRGDPAGVIRTSARAWEADVIAMATHRRRGIQAFWEGSVAHKVASYARRPVLLVPVREGEGL